MMAVTAYKAVLQWRLVHEGTKSIAPQKIFSKICLYHCLLFDCVLFYLHMLCVHKRVINDIKSVGTWNNYSVVCSDVATLCASFRAHVLLSSFI